MSPGVPPSNPCLVQTHPGPGFLFWPRFSCEAQERRAPRVALFCGILEKGDGLFWPSQFPFCGKAAALLLWFCSTLEFPCQGRWGKVRLDLSQTCSDKKCLLRSSWRLGRIPGKGACSYGADLPFTWNCQERGVFPCPPSQNVLSRENAFVHLVIHSVDPWQDFSG